MSVLSPMSQKLRHNCENPPDVGQGRHAWLYTMALSLAAHGLTAEETAGTLEEICIVKGWHDRMGQIARDVEKAFSVVTGDRFTVAQVEGHKWPQVDDDFRRVALAIPPLFSVTPRDPPLVTSEAVLRTLYAPGSLVCIGFSEKDFTTLPVERAIQWAPNIPFIVANTMTARLGLTTEGYWSKRSIGNACTPEGRRFIVIEFDGPETLEQQAAMLSALHAPGEAELVLVVFSGRRSLHGWFDVSALSPDGKLDAFMYGVSLGCDRSLWDPSKLVRMPGGRRANGAAQPVLYWNPTHE